VNAFTNVKVVVAIDNFVLDIVVESLNVATAAMVVVMVDILGIAMVVVVAVTIVMRLGFFVRCPRYHMYTVVLDAARVVVALTSRSRPC
jgi:hypothetical protein